MYGKTFQRYNYLISKWNTFKIFLVGWDVLKGDSNFKFMCYSIVELLMVFEVSA